ncbi:FAD dependent oxidoreductase, partial [Clavulina sp. PMI_390]
PAGPPHNAPLPDLTPSFWLVADPDANPLAREGADRQLPPSDEIIDIVVIGSGITGVTFLLHIVKQLKAMASTKGYRIVMLEARDFCSGATGRNGGHFTPFIFDDFVERAQYDIPDATDDALRAILLEQHSISTMREFIQEHNWAQDVDFVENGHTKLFGATASEGRAEEEDARRDYDAAVAGGLPENLAKQVQWIGKEEMREKYVTKEGEPITGCHYDAANVWPLKLVTKLFQLAASTAESEVATTPSTSPVSVQLFTHTLVQSVTPSPSSQDDSPTVTSSVSRHNWTIATSRGSIQARYVIHATNAYASYLLPQFAPPPPLSTTSSTPESVHTPRARWIQPTRGQIIATRAAKLGPSEIWNGSSWLANRGWEYWFPRYWFPRPPSSLALSQDSSATPDSDKAGAAEKALIIIGGARDCAAPRGEPNPLEAGITDDSTVNPLIGEALRTFLPDVFPDLFNRETEPEYEWTGIMAYTKTLDPMVGPVPISTTSSAASSAARYLPGQFISAGYSGHGMPRAPACAEALAQMVLADMQCLSEGGTEMQWDDWKSKRPKWLPASYLT